MSRKAFFSLPGLFEFQELYRRFLPLYVEHRDWFYEDCEVDSLYGAPADCLWGGGRVGFGEDKPRQALDLCRRFGLSPRLTFSNSLLREEHLSDPGCNRLCDLFAREGNCGIIVHSDLLLQYLRERWPGLYFLSSTTKVLTEPWELRRELEREEFRLVVPDFRLNHRLDLLDRLPPRLKEKVEFLCNECCDFNCSQRKLCYEAVSRKSLGEEYDLPCASPHAREGYRFSRAKENPGYLSPFAIRFTYLPGGFTHFKLEGRGLGSAMVLEFLLEYLTKPDYRLRVREEIYLDGMLDLF